MILSPRASRRRGGAVVRARQDVQTLEHQTQANVLLAFKLSMVSGNGVSPTSRPSYRTYRKMADIGVQCDPFESEVNSEPTFVNSTVAEINTSAEIVEVDSSTSVTSHPMHHCSISTESSASSSSGNGSVEERMGKKPLTNEELDVDAICVQQSATEEEGLEFNNKPCEKTVPDGFLIQEKEKEESTCGLDCLYFTMQCCECTIL